MDACYHHLYEYGSIGIFGVIGRPTTDPGSPTSGPDRRRTMTLRWTFDERVEDGLVAGYALKRAKQILEDPDRRRACRRSPPGSRVAHLGPGFLVDSPPDRYADRMPGAREPGGWGESRVSFFQRPPRGIPPPGRLPPGQGGGLLALLQDGRERVARPASPSRASDYINFGSNNYLSLSYHPAGHRGRPARPPSKYGTGVTGSRLLNGTLDLHRTLEAELADVLRRARRRWSSPPATSPTSSTISGLLNRHDYVVLDKDAHNSLLTGAQPLGRHDEALRAQRPRAARQDPRRAPRRAGQGASSSTASTRWAATPRRSPRWSSSAARYPNTFLLDDEAHGLGRARRARPRRGRAPRRARRHRPHHHHVLEDPRVVRWRADRLGRRHRAAHARRRSADLHRVEHAGFASPPRSRRSACCATTPR